MNSRQRRGVVLLVVSVLCAVAAFAGVVTVIGNARSEVGPKVTAYQLTKDVPAYTAVTSGQLEKVRIPEKWLPDTAVRDLASVQGMVAAIPLKRGSLLESGMVAARPVLQSGQMEIAIMIDAETGVAGKITPGSKVNIFATFAGKKDTDPDVSKIIVTGARVIDVGEIKAFDKSQDSQRQAAQGVPITFALDAADAQRVAFSESFARHVRLALIAPGDDSAPAAVDRTYTLAGDTGGKR
ncbi:Flp pilus assembly protein CpaB [Streptomyces sp. SID13666]|uniref:Flp pilus assembly protein CpaB n=1 Tax=Streptomyces TaxID=1883 RepID=UPI001106744D|nr:MULTISPECIES: Flp pilus assembly protein CpaB [Streptomyces]MCZ4100844.1 Flp pilus assembly protein CpaB [Streptomyces sp. H39-C1]NEA58416.1 Flp pilus assembly protein CpaB [Streptomyces sp. SID13666]NEA73614.1 Flp pilus assembly protein CpaB [Streptomyces sp. SID13588]QNA75039.1 Flp pilus assembly protein CpaB [Streptomyces sp. So13.3]